MIEAESIISDSIQKKTVVRNLNKHEFCARDFEGNNKDRDLVSVIVPVYKVEEILLRQCIESILHQSYRNLEILLIDDGSPDISGKVCDEYSMLDERIIVFHIENSGVSVARNYALSQAIGSYIMFVDSDDYLAKNCIELLHKKLKELNVDCVMCGTDYINEVNIVKKDIVEKDIDMNNCLFKVMNQIEAMKALFYLEQVFDGYEMGAVWGCLYKREVIGDILFNPKMKIGEDFAFKYQVFLNIKKIVCLEEKLYHYLIRSESAMRNGFNAEKIETIEELDKMISRNMDSKYKEGIISRSVNIGIVLLFMIPMETQYEVYRHKVTAFLRKYRKEVLLNYNSRKKVKIALILSYLGFEITQRIFELIKRK